MHLIETILLLIFAQIVFSESTIRQVHTVRIILIVFLCNHNVRVDFSSWSKDANFFKLVSERSLRQLLMVSTRARPINKRKVPN